MTQSYVDNTGTNLDDMESSESFTGDLFNLQPLRPEVDLNLAGDNPWLYFLKESCVDIRVSNWRCSETLSEYLGMSIVMGMLNLPKCSF